MPPWKPRDEMTILGTRYPRLDGAAKVSGAARYTYDQFPKGCLHGAILSCPHAAAKILAIDASAAEKLPGVKAVLTDIHPTGTVRHAGEGVAAVAAVSPDVARDALERIRVRYEVLPHSVTLDDAMREGSPRVFEDRENVQNPRESGEGDVEAGFGEADAVVEEEYRTQVQTHSTLEVHGSVALWDGDTLTLWDSTQAVHGVRRGVARQLGLDENKVRVICQHMGAGFGSKLQPGSYSVVAAKLARAAAAPVKLMLTRAQDSTTCGNRPDSLQRVKIAGKKDGQLTALAVESFGTGGIAGGASPAHPYVYEVPNWKHVHRDVFTNAGAARPFRAPGRPQGCFAMESALDELAAKLGIDPLEMRLRNDPSAARQEEWKIGAARAGWPNRRKTAGSDPGPRKRGLGLAASHWAVPGSGTQAQITVTPDGGIEVRCGTQDIGTGTRTIIAGIAAEEFGLRVADIRPLIGDSDYPYSGASGGSMTAPSVSPAIKNTAEKAKARLAELAAGRLGVAADAIRFEGGRVLAASDPSKSLAWREACALLGDDPATFHGEWVSGLSGVGVAGCQFADVEVDTETGKIQVMGIVAVADCGLVLDRLTTESQVIGAVLQGISFALYEERLMDPATGLQVNTNYENYRILGALETPAIDVVLYDEAERGVLGIGEPPTIPTSAAIANAVFHATGVRIRSIPMTPDRVLAALERHRSSEGR